MATCYKSTPFSNQLTRLHADYQIAQIEDYKGLFYLVETLINAKDPVLKETEPYVKSLNTYPNKIESTDSSHSSNPGKKVSSKWQI